MGEAIQLECNLVFFPALCCFCAPFGLIVCCVATLIFTHLSLLLCLFCPLSVGLFYLFFLRILNLLLHINPSSPVVAPILCSSFMPPIYLPPAWILQASRLLPDDAEAPGGKNWQGRAAAVQPGTWAWGAREKVLDHNLDRDDALRLLRPLFWTLNQSRHTGLT